jgi:hypothetical protein
MAFSLIPFRIEALLRPLGNDGALALSLRRGPGVLPRNEFVEWVVRFPVGGRIFNAPTPTIACNSAIICSTPFGHRFNVRR